MRGLIRFIAGTQATFFGCGTVAQGALGCMSDAQSRGVLSPGELEALLGVLMVRGKQLLLRANCFRVGARPGSTHRVGWGLSTPRLGWEAKSKR